MSINLSVPNPTELRPRITVFGVGGAGGNAVGNMINSNLEGVDFVIANTDAQALSQSQCERRIQMGVSITEGLGAGARPEIGRAAAEETLAEIMDHLAGSHMVFITAGMGGGTGTGAAPVIARAAKEQGILTVGVITKPFQFEGARRMRIAEEGIQEFQKYADTLLIIPNQHLFRVANEKTTFADAFAMADQVLHSGVRGITDLMVMPGLINLDFADVRTVMDEMGKAMMGTGEAEGENRARESAEAAISNPLLDDVSMKGARGVLINITGGLDLCLYEVDEAANRIREEVDPDANIIVGSTFDERLEGRMRVSVVATGIDSPEAVQPDNADADTAPLRGGWRPGLAAQGRPTVVAMTETIREELGVSAREEERDPAPAGEAAFQDEAAPSVQPDQVAQATQAAQAAQTAQAAQAAPSAPQAQAAPSDAAPTPAPAPREAAPAAEARPVQKAPKRMSVFDRMMAGVKSAHQANQAAGRRKAPILSKTARPKAAPSQPPAPQRSRAEEVPPPAPQPKEQLFTAAEDEEQLEIPAFLRRQAN